MTHHEPRSTAKAKAQKYRIAIIGAGPGAICMAIRLKKAGIEDFVMLERADGAGGTWYNNRYPGLACDVPSALYSFSFEPKPDWSRPYGTYKELRTYMQHCVRKYELDPHIRLNTEVTAAHWDDAASQWHLKTGVGDEVVADICVSALGMFNEIQWPEIPGLKSFSGQTLHTANWPEGIDLSGRTIAVIGTAASAVQMIPELAKVAKKLTVFQRTANWIFPKEDTPYTEAEIEQMRSDRALLDKARAEMFEFFEQLLLFDKPELMEPLRQASFDILAQVKDPVTREKLTPHVPIGAQRPLFSNEYYPAFNRPNVELVTEPIETITAHGVKTKDGTEHKVDTLIFATGYAAMKYLSVIDVTGRGGLRLADAWDAGAQAYLGITTSGFPNLFMCYGPNTNNGSILFMLECQTDYIMRRINDIDANGLAWIDVRPDVMERYNEKVQAKIESVEAWRTVGSKYYRSSSGRIVTQWPGTMREFKAETSVDDLDAFETSKRETATVAAAE